MLDSVHGILRLEIQAKREKIKRLNKKYKLKSRNPELYINPARAYSVIEESLAIIAYENNFINFNKAVKIIKRNNTLGVKMKNNLIHTISMIRDSDNIDDAEEKFLIGIYNSKSANFKGCKNTFINNITRLKKLCINPVTISSGLNIDEIGNPLNKIRELVQHSRTLRA
jgi:hypothetical protein